MAGRQGRNYAGTAYMRPPHIFLDVVRLHSWAKHLGELSSTPLKDHFSWAYWLSTLPQGGLGSTMRPSLEYLAVPCYMQLYINRTRPGTEARSKLRMEKTQGGEFHLCGTQPSFLLSKDFWGTAFDWKGQKWSWLYLPKDCPNDSCSSAG